jgi:AraC-like DNA-binding protein
MLNQVSGMLAAFTVVSTAILLFAYLFFLNDMAKTNAGKLACAAMLGCLGLLQLAHYTFFTAGVDHLVTRAYCAILMMTPISFFFFAREILFPDAHYRWSDLTHLIPLTAIPFLAVEIVPGAAFLIGTAYTFWFARIIFGLREQRSRFKFEIFFFGMFAIMAFAALVLGLSLPFIEHSFFYFAYSNSISIAMILVVAALLIFPELLGDIQLIVELSYAKSKIHGVDTEQKVAELERLMLNDKPFEDEQLSLATVAELVDLSSHQLSELINTEYGYGFPRLIREHRVRLAKTLLIGEPNASVLAISMMAGFKSQSSFYTAFKEATGEAPGNYRSSRIS